ncbi:unnamed protein product, partial [Porites evermanni]
IAPITVVTHRDTLRTEEECESALYAASAASDSLPSHTFWAANYTKENSIRRAETERMTFDILHYALLTAETAVKIMKQKQRNEEEDEMMRALEGTGVSGQVAQDSAEGGDSEQVFRCCFADGLNQSLVSSVAQDESNGERETRETGDEA